MVTVIAEYYDRFVSDVDYFISLPTPRASERFPEVFCAKQLELLVPMYSMGQSMIRCVV